jgi:HK97 family phage major capsid protein
MGEKGPPKRESRKFTLSRAQIKEESRSVELAFSSEEPVTRGWGIEILDHSPGAMRMDRANQGIPILFNHDRDAHLGVLEACCLGDDKKARGVARFSRSALAEEKWRDVSDGILKDVSVGYAVHFVKEIPTKELPPDLVKIAAQEKLPVYRITDWEPFEASLVTVPADPTVGVGRSADPDPEPGDEKVEEVEKGQEVQKDEGDSEPTPTTEEVIEMAEPKQEIDLSQYEQDMEKQRKKAGDDAREKERLRVQGINDIYEKFRSYVPEFIRRKAVDEGMPLQEYQDIVLKRIGDGSPIDTPVTELGLSKQEIRRYSITRAILSQWKESGVDASFERACHSEIERRLGNASRGIFVPFDVMRQPADPKGTGRRDLSVGTAAAGGYLVGTDHLGSEFIDLLRNMMLIRQLGAKVLSGLRGSVVIPRRTAGATTYWVTEGTPPTEGANTFGQLSLSPKSVAANLDYTRNLLLQSNPSIDSLVNGDLAKGIALAVDLAAFHGSGAAGEPTGIANTSGIGSVTGTSIAYGGMLEFQTDVAAANALAGNCAYVTTPAVAALLAQRARFSNTDTPLWKGNILQADDVCGFKGFSTNQISAGNLFFGDFSQVFLAEWGVLELVVDPYTQSKSGIIQVTAFQSVDVGVRYPGAFSLATSVT